MNPHDHSRLASLIYDVIVDEGVCAGQEEAASLAIVIADKIIENMNVPKSWQRPGIDE
jgi:hypothetical protein